MHPVLYIEKMIWMTQCAQSRKQTSSETDFKRNLQHMDGQASVIIVNGKLSNVSENLGYRSTKLIKQGILRIHNYFQPLLVSGIHLQQEWHDLCLEVVEV